nr:acyltransferase family protein [Leifsonia psychrotolerans]
MSPRAVIRPSRIRADVQGLRAIAVLAVIADHLFGWPTGGFVGVDIFFVLSGFLITGILMREYEKSGHISFRDFYARRIRRILPAAMLVLVATVAAAAWLLPRGRALEAMVDSVWAALFAANWRMASVGTDYFQKGLPPSPFQHYWSLSVEEQFYFVWPVVMVIVLFLAAHLFRSRKAPRVAVFSVLVALTLGSMVWGLAETSSNPTVAYFSSLTRVWELGVGAILALAAPLFMRVPASVRGLMAWIGLVGIGLGAFLLDSSTPFPMPGAILPVLATTLVLAAGIGTPGLGYDRMLWPITNRLMGYVGNISYSLYLWHLPVIVLLVAIFPADSKKYYLTCLVLITALSIASYHWVENPIRKSNWLRPAKPDSPHEHSGKARLIVVIAIIAAVTVVGGAVAVVKRAEAAASPPSDLQSQACVGAAALDSAGAACDSSANGDTVWPAVSDVEDDTGGAFSCWRKQGGELRSCNYGAQGPSALRVALVGDSHAAMLVPALLPQLERLNWSLDTYLGYGCQWRESPIGSDCGTVMAETQARLTEKAKPYDLIITTSARWANGNDLRPAVDGAARYWAEATGLGTKVVAVADNPGVSEDAMSCIARVGFNPATSNCSTPRDEATAVPDPLVQTVERVKGSKLVDMTDFFCIRSTCPAVIGNVIVYRDTAGHLTATYSKTLGKPLTDRILSASE